MTYYNQEAIAKILAPVSDNAPCGDNKEYDQKYILLFSRIEPKQAAQYGDFTSEPESINWVEVNKCTEELLAETKDIRLLVLWLRAQTNLHGASGLSDGLQVLCAFLQMHFEQVHPSLNMDGERDELILINALSGLNDYDGLLSDVRQIYLNRSNVFKLQVRDIERALGAPRATDAMPIATVAQQINDFIHQKNAVYLALVEANKYLQSLNQICLEKLHEFEPNTEQLTKLLQWFSEPPPELLLRHGVQNTPPPSENTAGNLTTTSAHVGQNITESSLDEHSTSTQPMPRPSPMNRADAQELIRQARYWFEHNEPSSPIVLLLKQSEMLVGKPYHQVYQAIPMDLVERWTAEDLA